MKRLIVAVAAVTLLAGTRPVLSQSHEGRHEGAGEGRVHTPDSTIEHPEDHGASAHTNHVIHLRSAGSLGVPSGLSPQQIRSAYQISPAPGSPLGSGTIAIIDAYDYPTALPDFNTFAGTFGLPTEPSTNRLSGTNKVFQVVYANGRRPQSNCGWGQEAALDIEWAHAMAPAAKIVLVEAASSSFNSLFQAIQVANNLSGVQQISMSWGGREFSYESLYDTYFSNPQVAYFAASGDAGGQTLYPSVSPHVISAGGTTLNMSGSTFLSETGWSGSGGGPSLYEPIAPFQSQVPSLSSKLGNHRGTPDWSFDADPYTGVSVFDGTSCQGLVGWLVFGGTSVAAPSLAGIANLAAAAQGGATGNGVGFAVYNTFNSTNYATDFRDITSGGNASYKDTTGWDFVTGVGSSVGLFGK